MNRDKAFSCCPGFPMLDLIIRSTFLGEALWAMAVVRGGIETGHTNCISILYKLLYIYIIYLCVCDVYMLLIDIDWH